MNNNIYVIASLGSFFVGVGGTVGVCEHGLARSTTHAIQGSAALDAGEEAVVAAMET